jgi:hypothetical protein
MSTWTELFFLDEATALAAGHRPCFLCRRAAAQAFQAGFPPNAPGITPKAHDIDRVLHTERLDARHKRLHDLISPPADLPDGAMILQRGAPYLILQGQAHPWSPGGYGAPAAVLGGGRLITPLSTVAALKAGYRPLIHASAFA